MIRSRVEQAAVTSLHNRCPPILARLQARNVEAQLFILAVPGTYTPNTFLGSWMRCVAMERIAIVHGVRIGVPIQCKTRGTLSTEKYDLYTISFAVFLLSISPDLLSLFASHIHCTYLPFRVPHSLYIPSFSLSPGPYRCQYLSVFRHSGRIQHSGPYLRATSREYR